MVSFAGVGKMSWILEMVCFGLNSTVVVAQLMLALYHLVCGIEC